MANIHKIFSNIGTLRERYYEAFNEFDNKNMTTIMESIVGKALTNSFHKRLAYLEGKTIN